MYNVTIYYGSGFSFCVRQTVRDNGQTEAIRSTITVLNRLLPDLGLILYPIGILQYVAFKDEEPRALIQLRPDKANV